MTVTIEQKGKVCFFIVGYEKDTVCGHCGRVLVHGVRLSDGRTVGAMCLDKKLSAPKTYSGRSYRLGSELIIKAAKVAEFYDPSQWARFGVNQKTMEFQKP